MIITAALLIAAGVLTCLLGAKLFKLLLPLMGFVTGFMVGFLGFQGIFGTGFVSSAMAIIIALLVGILLAVLAFVFFDLATTFFAIAVGAMALSYLGVALGLREDGLLVFLLSVAGAIIAGMYAIRHAISVQLVILVTSFLGVAYILTGLFLVAGEVNLNEINENGVVATLLRVVDQSFLWFIVWVGGSLIASRLQYRLLLEQYIPQLFEYSEAERLAKKSN